MPGRSAGARAWQKRLASPVWTAPPNAGHRDIVELERGGRLQAFITQNIDGLHQKTGNTPDRVIEVQGSMHAVVCLGCGSAGSIVPVLERVRAGEADPECGACGATLKSAAILFGEGLSPGVMERAMAAAEEADLLIAVGTSLAVYPVAGVVPAAKEAGARLLIVNAEPTPFDSIADPVLTNPIGEVLPMLIQ